MESFIFTKRGVRDGKEAEDERAGFRQQMVEPVIYGITGRMAKDYSGGYWEFYTLSNGGFYMAPAEDHVFHVTCDNMFEGGLSAELLWITACLYAYSHQSFTDGRFWRVCASHFHRLQEYMFEHPEAVAILWPTD